MHLRLLRFGLFFVAAAILSAHAFAATPSFFDEGRAQASLQAIFDKAGHPTKVLDIDIRSNQLIVELQDPSNPQHVDGWIDWLNTGSVTRLFWSESISGPRPVQLSLPNPDLNANLFELKPDDLALIAKLADAAVKEAALEDPATVDRIELRRKLFLIPTPTSGDPEWSVEVTSGRERATIYAALNGNITHANLDGTRHAQRLDYLAGGKELGDVLARIKNTIGTAAVFKSVLVYDKSLAIEAAGPGHPDRFASYSADINGVYERDFDTVATLPGQAPPARFAIADVDWTLLPKLQQAARQRLELPDGRIPYVRVSKPDHAVGGPAIECEVNVDSTSDSSLTGSVVFDAQGHVVHTRYPRGKGPKLDLLDATSVPSAFDALRSALGEHAAVTELQFRNDWLMVTTRDLKNPDERLVFEYRGEALARSIMPPLDWPTFGPDWYFDLAQAAPVAAHWGELQKDALTRLGLADGKIERVTISKQRLFMPRNDRVLIEVRAESGKREGRVVYDLAGKAVDVVMP